MQLRRQSVVAGSGIGRDARNNHGGVFQRIAQEGRGEGGTEVVVGIAIRAMNHDEGAGDLLVSGFEREGAVEERAGRSAAESDEFGAGRGGGGAGGAPGGDAGKPAG